jgi:hypothetical protein
MTTEPIYKPRRRRWRHAALVTVLAIVAYAALSYALLPLLWTHYEHQRGLAGLPMQTRTPQGIPGDAINVGLIGDTKDILCAMHAAGWYPADPVTFRTAIEIIGSVMFDRPYRDAPVSPLVYQGRREDLAFEKPVGGSAEHRHHVRLWKVLDKGEEGRPVWLGAATYDRSVGISRYTGALTHHIAPDIDTERDALAADLQSAGMLEARYTVSGLGPTLAGRNGGGDPFYTDGEVWVLRLVPDCARRNAPPQIIPGPLAAELKDEIWQAVAGAIGKMTPPP